MNENLRFQLNATRRSLKGELSSIYCSRAPFISSRSQTFLNSNRNSVPQAQGPNMNVISGVTTVTSLVALFHNCVDSFGFVKMGHHFGRDFESSQTHLSVLALQLSRWGTQVQLDVNAESLSSHPMIRDLLEQIWATFQELSKISERYAERLQPEQLSCFEITDLGSTAGGLHLTLEERIRQRQKQTGLLKKITWALYDGENFDKLFGRISGYIDALGKLFPLDDRARQLAEEDIAGVSGPALSMLEDAARGVDTTLLKAVERKKEGMIGTNLVENCQIDSTSGFMVGSSWSDAAFAAFSTPPVNRMVNNTVRGVEATEGAIFQVGNMYGGSNIFDRAWVAQRERGPKRKPRRKPRRKDKARTMQGQVQAGD